VFPVNPNAGEVLGLRCYPSVRDVPVPIDLAVIAVPAAVVPQVLEDCGARGVKAVAIISSGFKEVGNIEAERRLVEIARKYKFRILGPNIVGIWDTVARVNVSFIDVNPLPGGIALISQSGALIASLLWWTRERGIGFSSLVSIGNRADVSEADLLEFFREDPHTRVVAIYMEGLGEGEGRRFLEAAYETARVKPVVVLKSGRSPQAARAARSHTGSLAGSDEAYEAAFKQAGILRAQSLGELLNWSLALAMAKEPADGGVVVLTHGGGAGVIAADVLGRWGVKLMDIPPDLAERLRRYMPPFGSTFNPVDLTGMMTGEDLRGALLELLRDDRVGAVLVWAGQGAIPTPQELRMAIQGAVAEAGLGKPLVASITGGEECRSAIRELIEAGIPCYESPEDAASALAAICTYYRGRGKMRGELLHARGDEEVVREIISRAVREERALLTPIESFEVAKAYGVPVVEAGLAKDEEEAVKLARALGYPVALAVETPDVPHKTEVGGIILNLNSDSEVIDAFHRVLRNVKSKAPDARILGVSIRKMMPRGVEVFVGARRDPVFGPLVAFGWGGVAVELLRDVSFRLAPLSSGDVEEMISETKIGRLLRGYRGRPLDEGAVKQAIIAVASLMEEFSVIGEIDVNPMFVYEHGAAAVDVKVYLRARR